ncbi:U3 small nucleolar RNA-associated protein 6 homolog [Erpetoichthys calabaricus]|uniref:U3 small nucleolar RNA-associated protein 6 homolog n=1 Tax=Erpetoichthys calabaricus TaxID=27687 RepID=UPI002234AAA7|nr:U3 small nucleolar RNA-associated protein 6 homolog [Erpetoichthys calabaricus]
MAEVIQQRIEDRIPELEQLERVGLFTPTEVRAMLKKVSALEYKLHRRIIGKDDFITYIQYEINVLDLIKKRRNRIRYHFKREEIEYPIIQRIYDVFKRATSKWKDDIQLWLSFVAFCKKWGTKKQLSKVFSSVLAIHPDKPALWITAAKWEMEDCSSSESARQLFLRALRFHPDNKKLYQEYFRMELMHAEKLCKEKSQLEQAKINLDDYEFAEEIMKGELAKIVYKEAIQKISGADFILSLLSVASLFDFAKDIQEQALQDLQILYTKDPLTWDFMAKRELEVNLLPSTESVSKQSKVTDIAQKEERCSAVYEEAVMAVPTEAMWTCYVIFCLERFKRKCNSTDLKQKRWDRMMSVCHRAHDLGLLQESLYKPWLHSLQAFGQEDKATEVAIAMTKRFSQSVETWKMSLQVLMESKSDKVHSLFQEALAQVTPKESLPLWILKAEWTEANQSSEEIEAFFAKGVLFLVPAVSIALKERYLDWSFKTGGIKKARKTFARLHECRPLSLEFFRQMLQIEKEQEKCKMENIRECYERALREFGADEEELWLDYIKEELSHHQGNPENCGKIYWRAMQTLQGEQVESFVSKHTLLQTGHS